MPRYPIPTLAAIVAVASTLVQGPAAAQATYVAAFSAGRAFMVDLDDPDPAGSMSATAAIEWRRRASGFALGIEGGRHRYLVIRQDLRPDVTGWASRLEDTRTAWRLTPFVRWGTRGTHVRLYGQLGMGLYLRQGSYLQQERESGDLVVDIHRRWTDAAAGVNLGAGLELFPGTGPLGLAFAFRTHSVLTGGGDGFGTGELGIVYRW